MSVRHEETLPEAVLLVPMEAALHRDLALLARADGREAGAFAAVVLRRFVRGQLDELARLRGGHVETSGDRYGH